jgi:hypothetical protein
MRRDAWAGVAVSLSTESRNRRYGMASAGRNVARDDRNDCEVGPNSTSNNLRNTRLKPAAQVDCGMNRSPARRSFSAVR